MFDAQTLPPCDVLLLKHVLADWGDDDATRVLRACRAALRSAANLEDSSGGRVLVADVVLPVGEDANGSGDVNLAGMKRATSARRTPCRSGASPCVRQLIALPFDSRYRPRAVDACLMLVGNRGERTHTRWQQLARVSGFDLEAVVKTSSPSIDLVVLAPSTS